MISTVGVAIPTDRRSLLLGKTLCYDINPTSFIQVSSNTCIRIHCINDIFPGGSGNDRVGSKNELL